MCDQVLPHSACSMAVDHICTALLHRGAPQRLKSLLQQPGFDSAPDLELTTRLSTFLFVHIILSAKGLKYQ